MTKAEQEAELLSLVLMKMPFGKYAGRPLIDLPVSYLEWFEKKGFPEGKLGKRLSLVHTLKSNGLQDVIDGIRKLAQTPHG